MEELLEGIKNVAAEVSDFLWGWPMMILLLGTHLYLTIRLRFPQIHIFKAIRLSVKKDPNSEGDVSQFGALATSLAATIGTGNIVGVGTAVALGGPGAVLWCWLTGVFGIATKYAEGLVAVKFRQKTSDGKMLGGAMFALEKGLGLKWLAVLFCVFTVLASFGIGSTVQSNSISMLLNESYNVPTWITGVVMSLLVALVIIYGVKGIARVCMMVVPFMALFYVAGCVFILYLNIDYVLPAIKLIVKSAFTPEAAGGGFVGGSILMVARYGIARGLFSNESGLGSAPIVAAAARTRNSVRQALVSSTGTFWDTVVICALTGVVIVSCIVAGKLDYSDGATLTKEAFSMIPTIGTPILVVGIISFAFSTILGWSYYAERALEYLVGKKGIKPFRVIWCLSVFAGAVINLGLVWSIADSMNALMAIPNLVSLILLSGFIVKETRKYLWQNRLDEYDPDLKS
ncbi:MAG: sodium:alanine symporter family protein [Bacteroidales bacterium]|nr:sodium:alanine symporter family protein [Candidatus Minthousia equi]MDO4957375.1 alanine/glycine:cation symporter family protein [Bacteroidales bacterium]